MGKMGSVRMTLGKAGQRGCLLSWAWKDLFSQQKA